MKIFHAVATSSMIVIGALAGCHSDDSKGTAMPTGSTTDMSSGNNTGGSATGNGTTNGTTQSAGGTNSTSSPVSPAGTNRTMMDGGH